MSSMAAAIENLTTIHPEGSDRDEKIVLRENILENLQ